MARLLLRDAVLLDPEAPAPAPGSLLLEGGRIAARLGPGEAGPADARTVDLGGRGLAPGFLDLHFHGPVPFTGGADPGTALRASSASLLRHGTTSFLIATVAWARAELAERVPQLASLVTRWPGGGAIPIGLHLEGPWLSPRAAGAQPVSALRDYHPAEGEELFARAEGAIRMVTLAPEIEGATELLAALRRREIVAALGHSRARGGEVDRAVDAGASHVTHLFNAMGGFHHREPGLAGAALIDDRLSCDLICDGVHVDPRAVRLAARIKGERLVLITDRVEPPDRGAAGACFGSGPLRDDGAALRLPDGRLAGSCVTLDRALRNAREGAGMTRLDAVAACTLRPARVLGVEAERGTLRPGARADLAVLDRADRVCETWLGGERVFPG